MAVPRKKGLASEPRGGKSRDRITPDIVKAAKKNSLKGVRQALDEDPSCVNDIDSATHMTALHWACANRNTPIFDILVAYPSIDLEPVSITEKTPAQLALESGAAGLADRLHQLVFVQDHLPDDAYDKDTNIEKFDPKEP